MKSNILLSMVLGLVVSIGAQAGEFLVKYKPQAYSQMVSFYGYNIKDSHNDGQYIKINVPKEMEVKVLADLYQSGAVETIVPNFKIHAFNAPYTAQTLKDQWHIAKVNADQAWAKAGNKGSHKVTVAVIDTGVDYNHESLKQNMLPGYDFHKDKSDPMDITSDANPGHGTHCAGIIGASGLVEGGTIGISPDVSIIPIRFLGEDGSGDLNNAIKAIDFAISKKVDVISASWGAAVPRAQADLLLQAIKRADDKGIIFVAAAANDGKNNDTTDVFPANASYTNTITVAASNPSDAKPTWSNYGRAMVSLASPGENIMSTIPGNKYRNLSGTSMATPLVSGLVAFLKAQDLSLTGTQIKAILQTTGAKVGIETQCQCRVDALKATEMILDKKMYVAPAAGTYAAQQNIQFAAYNAKGNITWVSSNEKVLKIAANGAAQTLADGEATITATDSSGTKAQTLSIIVGKSNSGGGGGDGDNGGGGDNGDDGGDGGGSPGGDNKCPMGDAATCQAVCGIMPSAPWCKK